MKNYINKFHSSILVINRSVADCYSVLFCTLDVLNVRMIPASFISEVCNAHGMVCVV